MEERHVWEVGLGVGVGGCECSNWRWGRLSRPGERRGEGEKRRSRIPLAFYCDFIFFWYCSSKEKLEMQHAKRWKKRKLRSVYNFVIYDQLQIKGINWDKGIFLNVHLWFWHPNGRRLLFVNDFDQSVIPIVSTQFQSHCENVGPKFVQLLALLQ